VKPCGVSQQEKGCNNAAQSSIAGSRRSYEAEFELGQMDLGKRF
jgi:hypothetical protein